MGLISSFRLLLFCLTTIWAPTTKEQSTKDKEKKLVVLYVVKTHPTRIYQPPLQTSTC